MQWHEILRIYVIISNNVVFKANTKIYLLYLKQILEIIY